MTVELALATHKIGEGPFKKVCFSEQQIKEIRYASLLHDFGKIGVRESVLLKKKKLKDRELESILLRFDNMSYKKEKALWKNLCEYLMEDKKTSSSGSDKVYQQTLDQIEHLQHRIERMRSHVITVNEPQVMSEDLDINELIEKIVQANDFFKNEILTKNELKALSIGKGSLTLEERNEIESHVSHTYDFFKTDCLDQQPQSCGNHCPLSP